MSAQSNRRRWLLLALVAGVILLFLPLLVRTLLGFNRRAYSPAPANVPLLAATPEPTPTPRALGAQVTVADPTLRSGPVVIDFAHFNQIDASGLQPLASALAQRGLATRIWLSDLNPMAITSLSDIPDQVDALRAQLSDARAMVVISPYVWWQPGEVDALERFVADGGRLLLISDPDITGDAAVYMNLLSERFGIVYNDDYLYDTVHNDENFTHFFLSDFSGPAAGLDGSSIAMYGGRSISGDVTAVAHSAPTTLSSRRTGINGFTTVAIGGDASRGTDGRVLALADFDVLTEPNVVRFDNQRLVEFVADFLAGGARDAGVADFPEYLGKQVTLLVGAEDALNAETLLLGARLQRRLEESGRRLALAGAPAATPQATSAPLTATAALTNAVVITPVDVPVITVTVSAVITPTASISPTVVGAVAAAATVPIATHTPTATRTPTHTPAAAASPGAAASPAAAASGTPTRTATATRTATPTATSAAAGTVPLPAPATVSAAAPISALPPSTATTSSAALTATEAPGVALEITAAAALTVTPALTSALPLTQTGDVLLAGVNMGDVIVLADYHYANENSSLLSDLGIRLVTELVTPTVTAAPVAAPTATPTPAAARPLLTPTPPLLPLMTVTPPKDQAAPVPTSAELPTPAPAGTAGAPGPAGPPAGDEPTATASLTVTASATDTATLTATAAATATAALTVAPAATATASTTATAAATPTPTPAPTPVEVDYLIGPDGLRLLAAQTTLVVQSERADGRRLVAVIGPNSAGISAGVERLLKNDFSDCIVGVEVTYCPFKPTAETRPSAPAAAPSATPGAPGAATPTPTPQIAAPGASPTPGGTPRLLLIDDDAKAASGERSEADTYLKVLSAAGYAPDLWSTAEKGAPTADDLKPYTWAIWSNAGYANGQIEVGNLDPLFAYLGGGGRVTISSRRPFFNMSSDPASALRDVVITDAMPALVAGMSGDPITLSGALGNVIPLQETESGTGFKTILKRGPQSEDSDRPAASAGSDAGEPDAVGSRMVIVGFSVAWLPDDAADRFIRNMADWVLSSTPQ